MIKDFQGANIVPIVRYGPRTGQLHRADQRLDVVRSAIVKLSRNDKIDNQILKFYNLKSTDNHQSQKSSVLLLYSLI